MRKIFIDCGAHKGFNIGRFLERFEDADQYEIFAFECFPDNIRELEKDYGDKCTIYEAAISTHDKYQSFTIGGTTRGGTLRNDKTMWVTQNTMMVKCMNFSKWLKENFSEDDYIIVSFDIEGAEYEILESMKADDTLKYMNKFYVEFHGTKLATLNIKTEHDWIKYLKEYFKENVFINAVNNNYQLDEFKRLNQA